MYCWWQAPLAPFAVSFTEWEYYKPPEAKLKETLRLLVDANADKVVVVAGMFGRGKSSLARHIACNPDKLQKVKDQTDELEPDVFIYALTSCVSLGRSAESRLFCIGTAAGENPMHFQRWGAMGPMWDQQRR